MNKLLQVFGRHRPDVNALSAHLDGQLNAVATARLDAHLTSCADCRGTMDGLHAMRDALRALPDIDAPRSFRLRVADVERTPAAKSWQPSPILRWAPAVSAVAAVVLVVALGVDFSSGGGSSNASRAPLAASQAGSAKSSESASATEVSGSTDGDIRPDSTADRSIEPAAPAAAQPPAPGSSGATGTTPIPSSGVAQRYDATGTAATELAARPGASPTSELQATSGRESSSENGNNLTALRVLEIVAGTIAVVAGATAIVVWRRRGDRL